MSTKKTGGQEKIVKARLYKNNTSTAAKAPYLGRVVHNGTHTEDDIIAAMVEKHPALDAPTAKLVFDLVFSEIADCIREGYKVSLPFALFESHITGSFDSVDAPMKTERNKLVVKVIPSRAFCKKVSRLKTELIDMPQSDLALYGVETPSLGRAGVDVVTSSAALVITGRGLCDGTLKASIADAAGVAHAVTLTQVKSLYAHGAAPAGLAVGEARLTLVLTNADGCDFTVSRKITVA